MSKDTGMGESFRRLGIAVRNLGWLMATQRLPVRDAVRFEEAVLQVRACHDCSPRVAAEHVAYWIRVGRERGFVPAVAFDVAARDAAYGNLRNAQGESSGLRSWDPSEDQ